MTRKKKVFSFPRTKKLLTFLQVLFLLLYAGTTNAQVFDTLVMSPFSLPSCGSNSTPTFGDLDNDGDLDMISGNYYGNFVYYENTSTAPVTTPLYWISYVNPFALTGISRNSTPVLADLDSDGDLDLMTGSYNGNFIYFENTGTPSIPHFAASQVNPFSLSNIGYYSAPSFVDLDNDGDLDLMAGQNYAGFSYFENTGTATNPSFAPFYYNPFSLGGNVYNSTPTFSDLDSDGDFDLMSGGSNGNFRYYENIGTITSPIFAPEQVNPFSLAFTDYASSPTFGDIDNDGDMDILTGKYDGNFSYFENVGTTAMPLFGAPQNNPFYLTTEFQSIPSFADIDNDGDLDLLSGEYFGNLRYYENIGTADTPVFKSFLINPFSLTNVDYNSSPAFADLDNDGDQDLLVGEYSGNFSYFENIGSPSVPLYAAPVINPFSLTETLYTSAPVFVDLDADGDLDLMAGELEGGFKYYTNIGTASAPVFGAPQFNPFSLTDIGFKSTPTFADLDNDGDMDMLAGEYNAHFYYFRNTGTAQNPSFASVQIDPFTFTKIACMSAPAFADLDNDGDSDVLAGQMYGNFYFFENICVHPVAPDTIFETRATCPNEHFIFSTEETNGATSYIWTLPPGWTGSSPGDSILVICGSDPGIISVSASNSCGTSSPITYNINPAIDSIQPASPVLTDLSSTCSLTPAIPVTNDNCAGTITGTTSTIFPITEIGSHSVTWTFDDGNGNFTIVSQNITITAPSIDVSTTVNGLIISANNISAGISYQWVDCSTGLPINQETQQSFTASSNGSYAVILTDGLCSDTSDCVTINAINIYEKQNGITTLNVYPNPSTAIFTIENAGIITKLSLTDVSGKLILEKESDCKHLDLSGFETGMYILTATMENGSKSNTIIIRQK